MAMAITASCGSLIKPPAITFTATNTKNITYLRPVRTPTSTSRIRSQPYPYPTSRRRWQLEQSWRVTYSNNHYNFHKEEATLIWRAVKLPIYFVALVPLTVGSAAAYLQTRIFNAGRFCLFLFSSILIITWLNLSNDVYDFDTGVDKDKRESAVNICGSRSRVFYMAYICLVIGCGGLLWGGIQAGDVRVVSLLVGAILCGYVYQCPPFRLSYLGLGEPLCFAAFGPLATSAFYFGQSCKSQRATFLFSRTVLCVSLLVGVTTTLILFCSHFHQIDGDHKVGKMSPLVRMGTERGSVVVKYGVVSLYLLLFAFAGCRALPLPCLLFPLLTLPVGNSVIDFVQKNHNHKEKIFMAKYYCVRLHASFGAALAFGLFAATTI